MYFIERMWVADIAVSSTYIDRWFHQNYIAGVSLKNLLVSRTWNWLIHFTIKESDSAIESLYSEGNESALGKRRVKHGLQYAINYNVTRIFIGYQELSILQLTCLKQCYISTPNALVCKQYGWPRYFRLWIWRWRPI